MIKLRKNKLARCRTIQIERMREIYWIKERGQYGESERKIEREGKRWRERERGLGEFCVKWHRCFH